MTLEQLTEHDTSEIDTTFGYHLAEEVSNCQNIQALLDLTILIDIRIAELTEVPAPTATQK